VSHLHVTRDERQTITYFPERSLIVTDGGEAMAVVVLYVTSRLSHEHFCGSKVCCGEKPVTDMMRRYDL
jgi:hypothetical protein